MFVKFRNRYWRRRTFNETKNKYDKTMYFETSKRIDTHTHVRAHTHGLGKISVYVVEMVQDDSNRLFAF